MNITNNKTQFAIASQRGTASNSKRKEKKMKTTNINLCLLLAAMVGGCMSLEERLASSDPKVRNQAEFELVQNSRKEGTEADRIAAIRRVTNQELLVQVGTTAREEHATIPDGLAAIECLKSETDLAKVAKDAVSSKVRVAALKRITNHGMVQDLAKSTCDIAVLNQARALLKEEMSQEVYDRRAEEITAIQLQLRKEEERRMLDAAFVDVVRNKDVWVESGGYFSTEKIRKLKVAVSQLDLKNPFVVERLVREIGTKRFSRVGESKDDEWFAQFLIRAVRGVNDGEVLLRICDAHKNGREGCMLRVWGDAEALSPTRIANACNSISGLAKVLDERRFSSYGHYGVVHRLVDAAYIKEQAERAPKIALQKLKDLTTNNQSVELTDETCEDLSKKWKIIEGEPELACLLQPQIDKWKTRKGMITTTNLDGLCGVKFGDDISRYSQFSRVSFDTVPVLMAEFKPEQPVDGFVRYQVYATVNTHKIFSIRLTANGSLRDREFVSALEKKYNCKVKDGGYYSKAYSFAFPNRRTLTLGRFNDQVSTSGYHREEGYYFLTARDANLERQAKEEADANRRREHKVREQKNKRQTEGAVNAL